MADGRKTLRAHWPPRRSQVVQLQLNEQIYADVYQAAKAEGWSLQDEIRARIDPTRRSAPANSPKPTANNSI